MPATKSPRCRHNLTVCSQCVVITDAAKRIADRVNSVITFYHPWAIRTQWMAFRLSDGTTDGVLYDTKQDAIRFQLHEQQCLYFPMGKAGGGVNAHDCQILLNLHRHIYDNGVRIIDADAPGGGPDPILSIKGYEGMAGIRRDRPVMDPRFPR